VFCNDFGRSEFGIGFCVNRAENDACQDGTGEEGFHGVLVYRITGFTGRKMCPVNPESFPRA
jgi:hypothetical protein